MKEDNMLDGKSLLLPIRARNDDRRKASTTQLTLPDRYQQSVFQGKKSGN